MIDFEDQLRSALARKEPLPDFAQNVLKRAKGRERWKAWAAGCIAASVLVGSVGVLDWQQKRERQREELAGAQLVQALEITSNRLRQIHKRVERIN